MSTFAERFDSYYTQLKHQRLYEEEQNKDHSEVEITDADTIQEHDINELAIVTHLQSCQTPP